MSSLFVYVYCCAHIPRALENAYVSAEPLSGTHCKGLANGFMVTLFDIPVYSTERKGVGILRNLYQTSHCAAVWIRYFFVNVLHCTYVLCRRYRLACGRREGARLLQTVCSAACSQE